MMPGWQARVYVRRVRAVHFLAQERAEVKRRLEGLVSQPEPSEGAQAADLDQRIQRALYDAGLVREMKPKVKRPRERRPPIKIKGKPLSETIIEDRG